MSSTVVESVKPLAQDALPIRRADPKRWLSTGIKILVSASLIFYLVSKTNLTAIWDSAKSANMLLVLISFSLHGIGYFSSAYRWRILLQAQGIDIPVGYLVRSYAIAMFFNNILPSTIGGDAYRAYDTAKCNIPRLKALAIVVVERFLGVFALMVFAVMALVAATELATRIENLWIWSLATFGAMAAMVWLIFFHHGKVPWLRKILDIPGMSLVNKQMMKITESFAPFRGKTKALSWSLVLSLILQLNVIFHYYLISEALGLSVPFVKFLVIIPLATFVQMIPLSINGIGIRESFYVFFLTTVYGAPIASSLAFSWIAYGMVLLLGILGGVIYAVRK